MTKESPDWSDQEVRDAWTLIGLYKLQPGDEHPTKKGWFLTDQLGSRKEPLWYKPPSRFSSIVQKVALWMWVGFIVMGIIGAVLAHILSL